MSDEIGSAHEAARTAQASGKARAIKHWLTPTTLRGQFMLTEVLRPPKAMQQDQP